GRTTLKPSSAIRLIKSRELRLNRVFISTIEASSGPQTTMTRININTNLTRRLNLNQRVLRIFLIRPDRHEATAKNKSFAVMQKRLRIKVVRIPAFAQRLDGRFIALVIEKPHRQAIRQRVNVSSAPVSRHLKLAQLRRNRKPDLL